MKSIFTALFIIILVSFGSERVSASGSLSPWATDAVQLVNEERVARGIAPLTVNDQLDRAAAAKLADMEHLQYFAHTSPTGVTPWSWIEDTRYGYRFAGENLAIRFGDPEAEHEAWMASEKHCQNILDARFKETGFAVKKVFFEGQETMLSVEMFGTKQSDAGMSSGSKEDALALCRSGQAVVSGISVTSAASFGTTGLMGRYGISSDRMAFFAKIVALVLFALAELSSVALIVLALFRREWRNGVVI